MRRVILLAVLPLLFAACGGGKSADSATSCLEGKGATVKENTVTPSFASTGIERALVVTLEPGKRQALLLFAKNGILANRAEQQLTALVEQLAGQQGGALPVRRKDKALVSWLSTPRPGDDALIDKCL